MKKLFMAFSVFAVLALVGCGTQLKDEAQAKELSEAVTTGVKKALSNADWDTAKGLDLDPMNFSEKVKINIEGNNDNHLSGKATGQISFTSKHTGSKELLKGTRTTKGSASISFFNFGFEDDGKKIALNGSYSIRFKTVLPLEKPLEFDGFIAAGTPVPLSLTFGEEKFSFYMNFRTNYELGKSTTSLNVNGEKYNFDIDLDSNDIMGIDD